MSTRSAVSVQDSKNDRRRARDDRGLASAAPAQRTDRLPPAPRERRPILAALAVLLIVGGAATAGLLALRADERVPVLVAARDIAAGEAITEDALTTTSVASEGTLLVPASQAEVVVGTFARGAIAQGQLLDESMLTGRSPLQPGKVAVGAVLPAGRLPASGLLPGDVVQLVRVTETDGVVIVADALVSSARSDDADAVTAAGGATVTFIVDTVDGALVASVGASGDLAAVLVTRGQPAEDD